MGVLPPALQRQTAAQLLEHMPKVADMDMPKVAAGAHSQTGFAQRGTRHVLGVQILLSAYSR